MSSCTTTVPNSVRNSDPVGHTSRQAACVQCLHTSDDISHRKSGFSTSPCPTRAAITPGRPSGMPARPAARRRWRGLGLRVAERRPGCSMNATWRHWLALSEAGVVVGRAEHVEAVRGDVVPLLAGHLAGLAADADAGVGEEPLARRRVVVAGVGRRVQRAEEAVLAGHASPRPSVRCDGSRHVVDAPAPV